MQPIESKQQLEIDTVRILSADAVQKVNSGHPDTPMARAPMGHVRQSGTKDLYPIYAESFLSSDHLQRVMNEAATIIIQ